MEQKEISSREMQKGQFKIITLHSRGVFTGYVVFAMTDNSQNQTVGVVLFGLSLIKVTL